MLFNSFQFAIFLPIVFALYWTLPHKCRWGLLLVSSYYFYMSWDPRYITLIFLTTLISYTAALLMERPGITKRRKRCLLGVVLVSSIGVLFLFKYLDFAMQSAAAFFQLFAIPLHPMTLKLTLPVGISFYTFQVISYVIDVYKGEIQAERHFGKYAAFISFFPQLVAGPIERTQNLMPQIKAEHTFDYKKAAYGMKLMTWGLFKKLCIADVLAPHVDKIFSDPMQYDGLVFIITAFFFTLQVYCDFSGYSDIAIGTAKLFGIDLMINFKSPYFSASIKEFWSRWHISLSSWFRDYVYIPLGGNRRGERRTRVNLLITFLISGLWHGGNWTFVLWGGLHGVAQVIENALGMYRSEAGWKKTVRICSVFLFCTFAWIFFRADTVSDAFYMIANAWSGISAPMSYIRKGYMTLGIDRSRFIEYAMKVFVLFAYDAFSLKGDCIEKISSLPALIRWSIYIVTILIIAGHMPYNVPAQFIYFQF